MLSVDDADNDKLCWRYFSARLLANSIWSSVFDADDDVYPSVLDADEWRGFVWWVRESWGWHIDGWEMTWCACVCVCACSDALSGTGWSRPRTNPVRQRDSVRIALRAALSFRLRGRRSAEHWMPRPRTLVAWFTALCRSRRRSTDNLLR